MALSSGASEFHGIVKAVTKGIRIKSRAEGGDPCEHGFDCSEKRFFEERCGAFRRMEGRELCMQEGVCRGESSINKIRL